MAELKELGLEPILLTGDNERAARAVAAEVGIEKVIAEVLPADKVDVVERLQRQGRTVVVVGDGVNDAAALATSDLGIAMGTGTPARSARLRRPPRRCPQRAASLTRSPGSVSAEGSPPPEARVANVSA